MNLNWSNYIHFAVCVVCIMQKKCRISMCRIARSPTELFDAYSDATGSRSQQIFDRDSVDAISLLEYLEHFPFVAFLCDGCTAVGTTTLRISDFSANAEISATWLLGLAPRLT